MAFLDVSAVVSVLRRSMGDLGLPRAVWGGLVRFFNGPIGSVMAWIGLGVSERACDGLHRSAAVCGGRGERVWCK